MKKKLNNKGFTLVELLAVVVILLSISMVAITSISASIDRQNREKDEATEKLIESYGRLYLEEHVNDGKGCINVLSVSGEENLVSEYNLDPETLKQSNGKPFNGSVKKVGNDFVYSSTKCD